MKKLNPIKLKLLEDEVAAAEETIEEWERRIARGRRRSWECLRQPRDAQANASAELDRLREEHVELLALWEKLGMELEQQRD